MQRPEPASTELELDALIERLLLPDLYWHSIKCEECGVETTLPAALERAREDMQQAAAALVQLRDSEALARGKIAEQMIEIGQLQDRLEGYFKRLTSMDGLLANAEAEVAQCENDRDRYAREANRAEAEMARLLADPMNVGWQRAQDAIRDRAAAVSQWKAAKQRIAALEGERDALAKDAERLMLLLRNAMNWIHEAGTASGYGFYRTKNPHDFSPDPESCTADEFANHKAACDLWDRGEYDSSKEKGSEWLRSEDGKLVAHILRAPWGIGSYSETVPQVQALIDAINAPKERP